MGDESNDAMRGRHVGLGSTRERRTSSLCGGRGGTGLGWGFPTPGPTPTHDHTLTLAAAATHRDKLTFIIFIDLKTFWGELTLYFMQYRWVHIAHDYCE